MLDVYTEKVDREHVLVRSLQESPEFRRVGMCEYRGCEKVLRRSRFFFWGGVSRSLHPLTNVHSLF